MREHNNSFLGEKPNPDFLFLGHFRPWPFASPPGKRTVSKRRGKTNRFETVEIYLEPKGHPCFGRELTFKNRGHWGVYFTWIFLSCVRFVPKFTNKNLPKGGNVRYLEDPGRFGVAPLPGCNRDHQDDYIFRFVDIWNPKRAESEKFQSVQKVVYKKVVGHQNVTNLSFSHSSSLTLYTPLSHTGVLYRDDIFH